MSRNHPRYQFLRIPEHPHLDEPGGFIVRTLKALRLPVRERSPLAEAAAQGRAVRLFSANFKNTWIR